MKPLSWYAGGRQKAEFVARPLPDDEKLREALAAEASVTELRDDRVRGASRRNAAVVERLRRLMRRSRAGA